MKKILFLLLLSSKLIAQNPSNYQYRPVKERILALMIDSGLHIPRYNGTPSGQRVGIPVNDGAIASDTTNSLLYHYSGGAWNRIANYSELLGNTNAGSGYRWLMPSSQNIKTAFNGYSVLIDSSSNTDGLTFKVDTANIATKWYAENIGNIYSTDGWLTGSRTVYGSNKNFKIQTNYFSSPDSVGLALELNSANDASLTSSWGLYSSKIRSGRYGNDFQSQYVNSGFDSWFTTIDMTSSTPSTPRILLRSRNYSTYPTGSTYHDISINKNSITFANSGNANLVFNTAGLPYKSSMLSTDSLNLIDNTGKHFKIDKNDIGLSSGYTNLTQFVSQTNWRMFYSDGSGDVQELALGTSGQYLKSNGASSVPSWDTPAGSGTVNSGAANKAAYYPSSGTTVDDWAGTEFGLTNLNNKMTAQATTDVILELKAAASQTANVLNISSSSGTGDLAYINSAGKIYALSGITSKGAGTSSEQFGLNSVAAHNYSVAVGNGASVNSTNGLGGVALGYQAQANENYAVAIGYSVTSSGANALAIGKSITASGSSAVSFGNASTATGSSSLAIGASSTSSHNSTIAIGDGSNATGSNDLSIGHNAYSTGSLGVAIGYYSTVGHSASVAFGAESTTSAANQLVIGSLNYNISNMYIGSGPVATTAGNAAINGSGGSGTNVAGAYLALAGGKGTGNAIGGNLKTQTSVPGASGTTLQTLGDRGAVLAKYTTLTESSATSFARVNIPSGTIAGGDVLVTVEANDATDYQARTLRIIWSAENKAGTTTVVISTPEEVVAASSGTLTVTLTATDAGSGNVDFKADATSSLTQTTLRANAQVRKNFGTGSITEQ
jgi:hypothetical protein